MGLFTEHLPIILSVFIAVMLVSVIGCYFYPTLALKCGAVAVPNFRSLHARTIPRGAGIVVVVSVLLALLFLSYLEIINFHHYWPIFLGGVVVSTVGFMDDCLELSAKFRLLTQLAIALWIYLWFADGINLNLGFSSINLGVFKFPLTVFCLVWFYNLFNFIDGSDGMAASALIYGSLFFSGIFWFAQQPMLFLLFSLLGIASLGFLIFNWPPAKIFFGDVGTSFCSYILSLIIIISIWQENFNLIVWLIVFGYYFADTTCTTLLRIIKYPSSWYKPHRSHAYQNLARIKGHSKILKFVWSFNLLWFLPLAIFAYIFPRYSLLFAFLAYAAIVPFMLKYGPLCKD